jgi:hypothetical protein
MSEVSAPAPLASVAPFAVLPVPLAVVVILFPTAPGTSAFTVTVAPDDEATTSLLTVVFALMAVTAATALAVSLAPDAAVTPVPPIVKVSVPEVPESVYVCEAWTASAEEYATEIDGFEF